MMRPPGAPRDPGSVGQSVTITSKPFGSVGGDRATARGLRALDKPSIWSERSIEGLWTQLRPVRERVVPYGYRQRVCFGRAGRGGCTTVSQTRPGRQLFSWSSCLCTPVQYLMYLKPAFKDTLSQVYFFGQILSVRPVQVLFQLSPATPHGCHGLRESVSRA